MTDYSSAVLLALIFGALIGMIITGIISSRRSDRSKDKVDSSYNARKHMLNLIVMGQLKQKAQAEKVDLDEMESYYQKFMSDLSSKKKDIDDRMEEDLLKDKSKK